MKRLLFYFFFLFAFVLYAQQKHFSLTKKLTAKSFCNVREEKPNKRKFLNVNNGSVVLKINPMTYLSGAFLFFYQRVISEQIQANCNYKISCSTYAKLCMEKKGPIRGFLLGLNQLSCCFGGAAEEHDIYSITPDGKIDNQFYE